jgi:hypothetical protein
LQIDNDPCPDLVSTKVENHGGCSYPEGCKMKTDQFYTFETHGRGLFKRGHKAEADLQKKRERFKREQEARERAVAERRERDRLNYEEKRKKKLKVKEEKFEELEREREYIFTRDNP